MNKQQVKWVALGLAVLVAMGVTYLKKATRTPLEEMELATVQPPGLVIDLPADPGYSKTNDFDAGKWQIMKPGGHPGAIILGWQRAEEGFTREESVTLASGLVRAMGEIAGQRVTATSVSGHEGHNIVFTGDGWNSVATLWYCPDHQRNIYLMSFFQEPVGDIEKLQARMCASVKCHQGKAPPLTDPGNLFSHEGFTREEGSIPPMFISESGEVLLIQVQADLIEKHMNDNPKLLDIFVDAMMAGGGGKRAGPYETVRLELPGGKHNIYVVPADLEGDRVIATVLFKDCATGKSVAAFMMTEGTEPPAPERMQSVFGAVRCPGR